MRTAAVCVVIESDKILTLSRPYDATKFGLPGGKSELGETPQETALRELGEETKRKAATTVHLLTKAVPRTTVPGESFEVSAYLVTLEPSEEGIVTEPSITAKWMTRSEFSMSPIFTEFNRAVLEAVGYASTDTTTFQYYDARYFEGPRASEVAPKFVELLKAAHPAEYFSGGTNPTKPLRVVVDLKEWPDDQDFPEAVWELFKAHDVCVID